MNVQKNETCRRNFIKNILSVPITFAVLNSTSLSCIIDSSEDKIDKIEYEASKKYVLEYFEKCNSLPIRPISMIYEPSIIRYPDLYFDMPFLRKSNPIFQMVEKALMLLNPENIDNPLSNIIKSGDTVVIKPNFVDTRCFPAPVTHLSIITPIIHYCLKAGACKVIIAEGPMVANTGSAIFNYPYFDMRRYIYQLSKAYSTDRISFIDSNFSDFIWLYLGEKSLFSKNYNDDVLTNVFFEPLNESQYYNLKDCNGYSPERFKRGLYPIPKVYLEADVFINVPKMKTHFISGSSLSLKNTIGIVKSGDFKHIPHYHYKVDQKTLPREWYNYPFFTSNKQLNVNNTTFAKTLGDLSRIVLYCDKEGKCQEKQTRKYLSIIDGIRAIEGSAPVSESEIICSSIFAGSDPLLLDAVITELMGFDITNLTWLKEMNELTELKIGQYGVPKDCVIGCDINNESIRQNWAKFKKPVSFQ